MFGILNRFTKYINIKKSNIRIMTNVYIDKNSNIGDYTFVGQGTSITKTTIGRYCSIAPNVSIGLGEHILNKVSTSSIFYGNNAYDILTQEPVEIGNDVWIGTRAVILRGVKIGDGAIIGAGAVVTKEVLPFSIVVGVPARQIKKRFSDEIIQEISKSKWWELDPKSAKPIIKIIENKISIETQ